MRKKIAIAVLAALPFFGAPFLFRQSPAQVVYADSSQPHYLKHLKQPKDEVQQILEVTRVVNTFDGAYGASEFIAGNIEEKVQMYGKEVTIVFHNYVQDGENVRYFRTGGIDILTKDAFRAVKNDVVATLRQAAEEAYNEHKDLSKRIINIQEQALRKRLAKDQKLEDLLDQKIPGYENLTVADGLGTPRVVLPDFVPSQFHVGPLLRALGVTFINSEFVGYDWLARQIDFVQGKPNILKHELTHSCRKLQGIPTIYEYDAEFHASMVMDHNALWFMRHPYLQDARLVAKVLFGFDAVKAFNDARKVSLIPGSPLDEKQLANYATKIKIIQQEIHNTFFEKFLPEYYANLSFWTAVNEDLNDGNAAFKICMWAHYQPTLLDGKGRETTVQWLRKNQRVIEEAAKEALEEIQKERNSPTPIVIPDAHQFSPQEKELAKSFLKVMGVSEEEDLGPLIKIVQQMHRDGVFDRLRFYR